MKESYHVKAGRKGGAVWAKKAKAKKAKRIEEYNRNPKRCDCCGEAIPYEKQRYQKYCSRSCAVTMNNQNLCRHGHKKIPKPCKNCGKTTKNKTFCSNKCGGEYSHRKVWEAIENGTWIDKDGRCGRTIRAYLFANRGHRCELCGLTEWESEPIPLTVHHVDGDATNNKLENVVLYCWNCHALTDNFGRRNQQSTRSYRYGS